MPIRCSPAPTVFVAASVRLRLRDWLRSRLGGTFLDYAGLKAGGDGQACVLRGERSFNEMCWSTRFHWGISTGSCYESRRAGFVSGLRQFPVSLSNTRNQKNPFPTKNHSPDVREKLTLRFSSKARQRLRSGIRVDFVCKTIEVMIRLSRSPSTTTTRTSSQEPERRFASKRTCFDIK